MISVAASGPNDELTRFSNYGPTAVDLAAPGIGVLSTLPGGRYGTENGTSMAGQVEQVNLKYVNTDLATLAQVRQFG